MGWLEALFGQVLATEEVMAEVLSGGYPAREEPIKAAIYSGWLREPLGNEPQKSTQSCNLFRLNNLRESEAGLTLFHHFRR